jgi:hypothetical protein
MISHTLEQPMLPPEVVPFLPLDSRAAEGSGQLALAAEVTVVTDEADHKTDIFGDIDRQAGPDFDTAAREVLDSLENMKTVPMPHLAHSDTYGALYAETMAEHERGIYPAQESLI